MFNQQTNNPLLQPFVSKYRSPPFDLIHEVHFIPAIETLIREAEAKIEDIIALPENPTFENTIIPLEQNGERLGIAAGILFNLNQAETNEKLQQIAREASQLLTDYSSRMLMNPALFSRIDTIFKNRTSHNAPDTRYPIPDTLGLSAEQSTVLHNWHRDFVRNGAMLDDASKKRFAEIRSGLSVLTLQFADNVLAETNGFFIHLTDKADLSGLPDFVQEAAEQEAESRQLKGWVFTMHAPSYVTFMKYSDHRNLREKMIRAFGARGNQDNDHDNKALIREIVNLRMEQASLMSEPDYASYMLKESMAGSSAKVMTFLEDIHRCSKPAAQNELADVYGFAQSEGVDFSLESWDWSYYAEKLRQKKYDFREELLKPFFKLENVIDGVFLLANKLYGLQFNSISGIPVYHPDVMTYQVSDENSEFLSLLYLDFFPRPGKQGGAWMTDFRGQSNLNGLMIRPQVSLVCNFSKPTPTKPSLLTFEEVTTFLHEFGHALHGMLSQCTCPSVSGTNVYRDFVELPSQMMENWALEKEWLDLFAIHFETGEKIPSELIDRLLESKNFLEGYAFERQLGFGFLDMAWHTLSQSFDGDQVAFEKQAMDETRLFRKIPGSSVSTGFSHIFAGGYAAGYYGYKWAEVLDADAFSLFSEKGIFDRDIAASFRINILEKGGSEHPMELYKRFRGQEPNPEALLERSGLL
ncbi:MAG: M3 family metallopeptidase [Bacteroidia bacterium]|nr:M3 family metallopeptidase [Bacteroidia bacterium]